MSDLISRKEAIELLRKNMSNDIQDQIITENNINLIESLPTAFDTEKVVEQLKEAETDISSLGHYAVYADDAIKIVLKGGTID